MKKLLIFLFILCLQTAKGQVYQLMPQYGYDTKRMNFDSTLSIPTFCGVPTLRSNMTKKAAVAYDSCNKRFYYYDPKLLAWDTIKGGGASSIDTTSLSNRINQRIDSLRRSGDSVYARKNGVWVFQYKDSVGSGVGTLQSVTDNGNETTNDIYINDLYLNNKNPEYPYSKIEASVTDEESVTKWYFQDADGQISFFYKCNSGFFLRNTETGGTYNLFTGHTTSGKSAFLPLSNMDTLAVSVNNIKANTQGNITLPLIDSLKRSTDSVYARKNGSWVFQYKDSIGGGSGFVPYTGATQDVDLGANGLTTKFVKVTGTGGDGHIDFKHQSADATAQGNSTVLFANSNGYLKWKNDNLYYSTLATPQTANRVFTTQDKSYTLGDSADIAARVKYTDTSSMLSPYQRKNISAYSMNVNNTNAAANVTETTYKQFGTATYSGTATWTGGTAPSGTTNHSYSWNQVGKLVTLRINLIYGTAGSALTQVSCTLPSDCPAPEEPAGIGAANDVISYGTGVLTTNLTATGLATVGMGYSALRVNAADNGYEIVIARASINARYAYATIQYFVP